MSFQNSTQNQSQETSQENVKYSTLRFSFPSELLECVGRMKLIGKDLLVYIPENKFNDVKTNFQQSGFDVVDRVYKLHVSANTKEHFLCK